MTTWPDELFNLIFFPHRDEKLDDLAASAEPEEWDCRHVAGSFKKSVLYNYLRYTYRRLVDENKIVVADDGSAICFNTGLVTPNQESIFLYADTNHLPDRSESWHFQGWKRKGEHDLTRFSYLPEMAHYFDDPTHLVLDCRKDLRINVDHIIADNKARFPEPFASMPDYQLQTLLKGAIDNAKERVRRNYKTAVPQYYQGRIQLLLPLCLTRPDIADLALVTQDEGAFYRVSTCLTLDMAYNNARQLARPDRDWLEP
jgi:hypothetical protein